MATDRLTIAEYRALVADKKTTKRRHKYGAKPQRVDGHYFGSTFEAQRYGQLKLLVQAKAIFDLKLQPRFDLMADGEKVGVYVGDFSYIEPRGRRVVEDTKGVETETYKLKRKIFKIQYPMIDFREIKRQRPNGGARIGGKP